MRQLLWRAIACALLCGTVPRYGLAQQPPFRITHYKQLQGLPSNYIFDLAQDAGGTLWIATDKGLAAYSGNQFHVYTRDEGLPANQIYHITPVPGALWLATFEGGAAHVTPHRISRWDSLHKGLPLRSTYHVLQDPQGRVYCLHNKGVVAYDGTRWHHSPTQRGARYHYDLMALLPNGQVLAALDGRLQTLHWQQGRLHTRALPLDSAAASVLAKPNTGYQRMRQRGDTLWLTWGTTVLALHPHKGLYRLVAQYALPAYCTDFWVTDDYVLALGNSMGLQALPRKPHLQPWQLRAQDGLGEDFCQAILQDYEGNLWVGTFGEGLVKLQPNPLMAAPWPQPVIRTCALRNGGMLFADARGVHHRAPDGSTRTQPLAAGTRVQHLYEDPNGDLWVGTLFEAVGPLKPEEIGNAAIWKSRRHNCGGASAFVRWQGQLYISHYGGGISKWDGRQLVPWQSAHKDLRSDMVEQLHPMGPDLLAVYLDQGVSRLKPNGQVQHLSASDGLAGNTIRAVWAQADTLWTATPKQVSQLVPGKAVVHHVSFAPTAPPRQVFLLLEDKRHRLWAVGERFLYLYTPEGMRVLGSLPLANDLGPVTCAAYNPHTDLLVLGHPRGLHTLDMALVDPVGVPPRLALTQAWVGDQAVNSADSLLRTNSAPQRVAFAFAVNSYVNEQLNLVQVRLQGYDEEWVTLGPDLKATFPQLPAGDYTLLARAVNADGLPSAPYTLLHIQVPAPFYLQGWFWLLGLLLATALGALVTRYIFHQRLRREQRKRQLAEALQRERERISRDLHDHMGAHLSYMLTRLNLMPHEDPQTQSLWKDLDGSLRTSMQHLRESIWALGAASITLPQLADRIRIFGQKRFLGTQTQFVLQLADGNPTIPTLKPDVALTLFRIAQEALNNAAKYAQAHKVTLSLTADAEQVTLSVVDDGLGFDPQAPHMDSYGLSGMQARAQELGGSWLLESAPGRGTRIAVRLPI